MDELEEGIITLAQDKKTPKIREIDPKAPPPAPDAVKAPRKPPMPGRGRGRPPQPVPDAPPPTPAPVPIGRTAAAVGDNSGRKGLALKIDFIRQAGLLAVKGFTNDEIAEVFGVERRVVDRWARQYPDFMETLRLGREIADSVVERALYQRAVGYTVPETVVNVGKDGAVTKVPVVKHYPPDVAAARYWLENRRREDWKNRQEVEVSGKDGKPLNIVMFSDSAPIAGSGAGGLGPADRRREIVADVVTEQGGPRLPAGQDGGRGGGPDDRGGPGGDQRQGGGPPNQAETEAGGDFCGGPHDDREVDAQTHTPPTPKIFQKNNLTFPEKGDKKHPQLPPAEVGPDDFPDDFPEVGPHNSEDL